MTMGGELCQSVLQSLELLLIDNDELLQPIVLDQVIAIALHHPLNKQFALLVSKILSYYASNEEVRTYGPEICLHFNCRRRGYWHHMII